MFHALNDHIAISKKPVNWFEKQMHDFYLMGILAVNGLKKQQILAAFRIS